MSRDIFIDAKGDDGVLGSYDSVAAVIASVVPVDFADPAWGRIETEHCRIKVNIDPGADPLRGFALHIHGDGDDVAIQIAEALGAVATDPGSGDDLAAPEPAGSPSSLADYTDVPPLHFSLEPGGDYDPTRLDEIAALADLLDDVHLRFGSLAGAVAERPDLGRLDLDLDGLARTCAASRIAAQAVRSHVADLRPLMRGGADLRSLVEDYEHRMAALAEQATKPRQRHNVDDALVPYRVSYGLLGIGVENDMVRAEVDDKMTATVALGIVGLEADHERHFRDAAPRLIAGEFVPRAAFGYLGFEDPYDNAVPSLVRTFGGWISRTVTPTIDEHRSHVDGSTPNPAIDTITGATLRAWRDDIEAAVATAAAARPLVPAPWQEWRSLVRQLRPRIEAALALL